MATDADEATTALIAKLLQQDTAAAGGGGFGFSGRPQASRIFRSVRPPSSDCTYSSRKAVMSSLDVSTMAPCTNLKKILAAFLLFRKSVGRCSSQRCPYCPLPQLLRA